jgi:hypothetical protein
MVRSPLNLMLLIAVSVIAVRAQATAPASPATLPSTQPLPREQPVVQYWDDGIYLANIKPFPLLAAWEDGTIICRARGHLYIGSVPRAQVRDLLNQMIAAGFFHPPMAHGITAADGPSQTIVARDGAATIALSHDGTYSFSQLKDVGDHASPSRAQREAFISMWSRCAAAIDAIAPDQLTRYAGPITWAPAAP